MRSTHLFLASITVLAGVGLVGCGDPAPTCNLAMDGVCPGGCPTDPDCVDTDAGMGGADAFVASTPVAVVGTAATNTPADFACAGANVAPTPGAAVAGTVEVQAIGVTDFPVAMGDIEIYPGATIRATCDGDCISGTTDADGQLDVTLPSGGWFGYRLAAAGTGASGSVPALGHFYPWGTEAGGTVTVTAISGVAANLIATQLNRELTADSTAVSGSVRDCDFEEVANLRIRFFRGDTEIVSGSRTDTTTPYITGLSDAPIPSPSSSGLTAYSGRFAGILPAAGGAVRIEAWGVTTEGGAAELVGCEEVLVEGGTVTVAVVPALRSDADYGASHSCAGRGE